MRLESTSSTYGGSDFIRAPTEVSADPMLGCAPTIHKLTTLR